MEFHEKLQELRKNRGLTQEELAEILYVSRTAVSKWESGRGYPSIDSLKAIAGYFSVSIDDLLSGEKLIYIAEEENKTNIRSMCTLLFGIADLFSFALIFLPLYPKTVDYFIYSVNLLAYTETAVVNRVVYWSMYLLLIGIGIAEVLFAKCGREKGNKILMSISMVINIFMILFLALAREAYAVTVTFLLLIMKSALLFKSVKGVPECKR